MDRSRGEGCIGSAQPPPTGKSQVAIGFHGNSGTDPTREAIGPYGFVRSYLKYVDD